MQSVSQTDAFYYKVYSGESRSTYAYFSGELELCSMEMESIPSSVSLNGGIVVMAVLSSCYVAFKRKERMV